MSFLYGYEVDELRFS